MNNSLLGETRAWFCAASVRNVSAKVKVDPLSHFRTEGRQMFTTQKLFPSNNSSNHENCSIKFPLNTFPDQITICQIYFEIFEVKQIDTRAEKIND